MERCTVWAVIGADLSRWNRFQGRMIRPRGVIGYVVMSEGPVLFVPGGIAPTGQPDFKASSILKAVEGLLLRPLRADSCEPDTSDAARGGAMFVDGVMQVMDLATFKAAMDAYYQSETARMPAAITQPGVGFPAAEIKSGPTKSPAIRQLTGTKDRRALASQAA